jgi:hypothetical protein
VLDELDGLLGGVGGRHDLVIVAVRDQDKRWISVVGRGGIEPPTFRFSGGRSYQLSYLPR